jgi:hypothetical protein
VLASRRGPLSGAAYGDVGDEAFAPAEREVKRRVGAAKEMAVVSAVDETRLGRVEFEAVELYPAGLVLDPLRAR